MSITCPHCRAPNDPDAAFCSDCGGAVDAAPPHTNQQEQQARRRTGFSPLWLIPIGAVFLGCVAAAFAAGFLLRPAVKPASGEPASAPSVQRSPIPEDTHFADHTEAPTVLGVERSQGGGFHEESDANSGEPSVDLPLPESSALGAFIPAQVGAFRLESAKKTDLNLPGNGYGVEMTYRSPEGLSVTTFAAAFPSEAASSERFLQLRQMFEQEKAVVARQETSRSPDNQPTGERILLRSENGDKEMGVSRVGILMFGVEGPSGHVAPFYEKLAY